MPQQNLMFPYPDGGLNESIPPHMIGDNQFSDVINHWYDNGGELVSRPGTEFRQRFYGYGWGLFCVPETTYGYATAVQVGSTFYGRSTFSNYPGVDAFTSLRTGLTAGPRFFATMNGCVWSATSDGSSTNDNLKWDPTVAPASAVTVWTGGLPALSVLCTWNGRMFGVHRNQRTKLYYSKVGDPEDFTSSGVSGAGFINCGYSDGDAISGLVAHNEQLFIFKEHSIWHIVTANPNTDNSLWRLELITKNYGCSGQRGILVCGNDILFPYNTGYFSLNAALYQGDFHLAEISAPINYKGVSYAIPIRSMNHYLLFGSDPHRSLYAFDKTQKAGYRWWKMNIYNPAATWQRKQIWGLADGYVPGTTNGPNYRGPRSLIMTVDYDQNLGPYCDLLMYPAPQEGSDGHYDYIGGPDGQTPIKKKWRSKRFNFGSFAYDKQSRHATYTYFHDDREQQIEGNEMTFSFIFNGDDTNEKTDKTINDVGLNVIGPDDTIVANANRSTVRTAVLDVGGVNGRIYKTVEFENQNNVGGYKYIYGALEFDVEQIGGKPTSSEKVLT